jgi:hypothetical protein
MFYLLMLLGEVLLLEDMVDVVEMVEFIIEKEIGVFGSVCQGGLQRIIHSAKVQSSSHPNQNQEWQYHHYPIGIGHGDLSHGY